MYGYFYRKNLIKILCTQVYWVCTLKYLKKKQFVKSLYNIKKINANS